METMRALRGALVGAFLLPLLALVACGGGGSSAPGAGTVPASDDAPAQTGDLVIAVTDAEGDFVVYEVTVERIDLTTAAGDEVQSIPASTRVDFADLTELSELLTVASIPAGIYRTITLQLDFTDAMVLVQDASGELREATLQDADGATLGAIAAELRLPDDAPVRVVVGSIAGVTLDFDLEASNEIVSFAPAVVRVDPFVIADASLDETRDLRVHGVLESVADDGAITVDVRPWRRQPATIGSFDFTTDAQTRWQIDDAAFVGAAGLDALAALPAGIDLVAAGSVTAGNLVADTVFVGGAVPGAEGDVVAGTVLARAGDLLTLGGVRVHRDDGPDRFARRIELAVDATTRVFLRTADERAGEAPGIAALSVGSRVIAGATQTGEATVTAPAAFDANGETVFLRRSALTAEVATADPFVVSVLRLDGRRPGVFDFSGTGTAAAEDADAAAYEVKPGVLSTADLDAGDLVRIRGLVADFGTAAPDFAAETLVDINTEDRGARLRAGWRASGGSDDALIDLAPDRIGLDLANATAVLRLRGILRDALPQDDRIALVPAPSGGIWTLSEGPGAPITVFRAFSAFVDALLAGLQDGERVASLTAEGRYDRPAAELTVRRLRVQWEP